MHSVAPLLTPVLLTDVQNIYPELNSLYVTALSDGGAIVSNENNGKQFTYICKFINLHPQQFVISYSSMQIVA